MDFFDQKYYRINKFLFEFVGVWPYNSKLQNRITVFIFTSFFIIESTPKVLALIVHPGDSRIQLEITSAFAANILSVIKFVNMIFRKNSFKKLLERIKADWGKLLNQEEKKILDDYAETGRILATGYAAAVFATSFMYVLEPTIPQFQTLLFNSTQEEYRFATPMEYIIIDKEKQYWVLIGISTTCIMGIISIIITSDVMFITFLQHACGLFAVVGHRLENFKNCGTSNEIEQNLSIKDNNNYNDAECVVGHHNALEFAELLEATYIWSFGFVVLTCLPMLSVTAVQVMTPGNSPEQLMKYGMFASVQVLHLFFDCFLSQKLTDHSLNLQTRIADGQWYNNRLESKKELIFITMRTQFPCYLTAGKIIVLSIENFGKMIKTAASYFTVIVSMQ